MVQAWCWEFRAKSPLAGREHLLCSKPPGTGAVQSLSYLQFWSGLVFGSGISQRSCTLWLAWRHVQQLSGFVGMLEVMPPPAQHGQLGIPLD